MESLDGLGGKHDSGSEVGCSKKSTLLAALGLPLLPIGVITEADPNRLDFYTLPYFLLLCIIFSNIHSNTPKSTFHDLQFKTSPVAMTQYDFSCYLSCFSWFLQSHWAYVHMPSNPPPRLFLMNSTTAETFLSRKLRVRMWWGNCYRSHRSRLRD